MADNRNAYDDATVIDSIKNSALFVIDHDFRTITVPEGRTLIGVESDDNVNTLQFVCDRYYDGVDLSLFDFRINYLNANDEGDIYLVVDKQVDEKYITFSWSVGRHACKYKGPVRFIVCARQINSENVIVREYNTKVYELEVAEGLEVDAEPIHDEIQDILAQLLHLSELAQEAANLSQENAENAESAAIRAEEVAKTFVIDATLTQAGQAADAKAVGDAIASGSGSGSGLPPAGNDGDVLYSVDGEWETVKLFDTDGETPKLTKDMVGYSVKEGATATLFDGSVPSQSGIEPGTRVGSFLGIPAFDYDEVTVTYNGTDYVLQKDPVETNGCTTYGYVDGQPDFTSVPVNFSCSLDAPLEYAVYVLSQNPNGYILSITATTSQVSVETSDEFDAAVRSVVGNAAWYKEVPTPTVLFDGDLTIQEDQEFGIYAAIPTNIIDSQISADTIFITVDYGETYEFDRQASSYDDSAFYGGIPGEATLINGQYQLNTYSYLLFGESYNFVFFKSNIGWEPGNVCHITIASKDASITRVPNDELEAAIKGMRGYELNHDVAVTVFEGDLEGNEFDGTYSCSFEPKLFDSNEAFITVDGRTYKLPRTDLCWHYGDFDVDEGTHDFTNYPLYIEMYPNGYNIYFETDGTHHLIVVDQETSYVVYDGDVYVEPGTYRNVIYVTDVDTSTMHFNTILVTVDGETYNMGAACDEYVYGDVNSDGNAVLTRYPVEIYMAPLDEEYYINFSSDGVHHVTVKAAGQTAVETSDEFNAAVNAAIKDGITIGNTTITEAQLQALLALLS